MVLGWFRVVWWYSLLTVKWQSVFGIFNSSPWEFSIVPRSAYGIIPSGILGPAKGYGLRRRRRNSFRRVARSVWRAAEWRARGRDLALQQHRLVPRPTSIPWVTSRARCSFSPPQSLGHKKRASLSGFVLSWHKVDAAPHVAHTACTRTHVHPITPRDSQESGHHSVCAQ